LTLVRSFIDTAGAAGAGDKFNIFESLSNEFIEYHNCSKFATLGAEMEKIVTVGVNISMDMTLYPKDYKEGSSLLDMVKQELNKSNQWRNIEVSIVPPKEKWE